MDANHWFQPLTDLQVRVASIESIAPHVKEFTLTSTLGGQLPAFTAGSHVSVKVPLHDQFKLKPYSLTSCPKNLDHYRIMVSKNSMSGGVSSFLHECMTVGSLLEISRPIEGMELVPEAVKHVLIAGGMGATPFLSHLSLLVDSGVDYEMHYTYPTTSQAVFLNWLKHSLPDRNLFTYASRETNRLDTNQVLASQPRGTQFYVSGPRGLVEGVVASAFSLGLPSGQIHFERSIPIDPALSLYMET